MPHRCDKVVVGKSQILSRHIWKDLLSPLTPKCKCPREEFPKYRSWYLVVDDAEYVDPHGSLYAIHQVDLRPRFRFWECHGLVVGGTAVPLPPPDSPKRYSISLFFPCFRGTKQAADNSPLLTL
ncbi:hypothetical protein GWI33_018139 [Rhynchophorus ferrugineus]|uniref:Uncharacterized protein n=1 Tax=Rhynchophorus ferrugineus TaxID=354439 RepID=A0A834HUC1_RHYFE|nr:hypothetical protein GWI33_018139 [Rhynchophorus ferrugineus]